MAKEPKKPMFMFQPERYHVYHKEIQHSILYYPDTLTLGQLIDELTSIAENNGGKDNILVRLQKCYCGASCDDYVEDGKLILERVIQKENKKYDKQMVSYNKYLEKCKEYEKWVKNTKKAKK